MTADVRVLEDGTRVVVLVSGEIDIATSPAVDDAVAGITTAELVLDLTGVTFMGSSGLASLLKTARRADEIGATLELRVSRQVRELLDMTHLATRFTIAEA